VNPAFDEKVSIEAIDREGKTIQPLLSLGWYSELYGIKEKVSQIQFETLSNYIETKIVIKL